LGIHNHQPVGNFPHVFREAYDQAYLPFLEVLERHPGIPMSLHVSGPLWEWIEREVPEYFDRIKALVQEGRVEILSGAFYEPILPVIPDLDKLGQMNMMTEQVKERFSFQPRGMWLAERVWEPHLPKFIAQAGIQYLPLDDYDFMNTGLRESDLLGYYTTEEDNHQVAVFPISQRLRYAIPFQEPEETLKIFQQFQSDEGDPLLVMADDGEKFGLWPGTHDWVYKKGWLDRFFEMLERNAAWVHCHTFGDFFDHFPPLGKVYLPTASYFEMGEWALWPKANIEFEHRVEEWKKNGVFEELKPFIKGGFWRNFLARYPESNHMHKKMLLVSRKLHALPEDMVPEEARKDLWRGMCNCAYWHGVFGGLYLPHLRHAVYKSLIKAEDALDRISHRETGGKGNWLEVREEDFDGDGKKEIILETPLLSLYFSPDKGGRLLELDDRSKGYNLLNTLARRPEGYHQKLQEAGSQAPEEGKEARLSIHDQLVTKEQNLEKYLIYDPYCRHALIDHVMLWDAGFERFCQGEILDVGNFVNQPYQHRIDHQAERALVSFQRKGEVEGQPIELEKTIGVFAKERAVAFHYSIKNLSDSDLAIPFGVEWSFALRGGDSPQHYLTIPGTNIERAKLAESGVISRIRELLLVDEEEGIHIHFTFPEEVDLWRFPVETVSLSEEGFERVYQATTLLFRWRVLIPAGKPWDRGFGLRLSDLK
jgi:alpha-amylase